MSRGTTARDLWIRAGAALSIVMLAGAAPKDVSTSRSPVADAASQGDGETVRSLLKQGSDVNAAQGDGMTALHWAALSNDVGMAEMLIYAGANVKATTRLGSYTALLLACERGHAAVVALLIQAGADPSAATTTGATPLMLAAASGDVDTVRHLLEQGANVNAAESARGQTPLMFAAANNRAPVIELLVARGADATAATHLVDIPALDKEASAAFRERIRRQREEQAKKAAADQKSQGGAPEGASAGRGSGRAPSAQAEGGETKKGRNVFAKLFGWMIPEKKKAAASPNPRNRRRSFGERVGKQGGLTPLLYAARQGHLESAKALLKTGVDINQANASQTTPLLIATMNGHFDLARYLLDEGADPNLANRPAGVTPLYAAINIWYAPKTSYPQPTAQKQQALRHVDLMEALLASGADPNPRLQDKIWFSAYNFDQSGIDETGATPFWRAAYASDVEAMRLLVSYGADPGIATKKPPERPRIADEDAREVEDLSGQPPVPVGGPAIAPLHAATGAGYGEGFASNEHRNHPAGWLPAVTYLVEELDADVNARDHEGYTPLHNAAARGDVEMIRYLVSMGADVTAVNREGKTTADMANGPVQRIQPFPEALALLTSLGATNNHKCVSC